MTSEKIVENTALPPNKIPPLNKGANNIFESAMMTQQNEAKLLNSLVGGIKRRKKTYKSHRIRGGAVPVVVAPSAPSFDTNPESTNSIFGGLSKLAMDTQNNAVFDNTTSQSQVAGIAAEQNAVYQGKGGKKRRAFKKGGSFPVWGCLSGGKKTKKNRKKIRCKSCGYNKKKHRKTCKIMKRRRN